MLVVEVIGNLGADATIREFSGQKFIAFSVAHTESYTNAQGQKQERTTWVSCLKYGESAVLNYLKKGTRVFVRGELSAKIYEANGSPQEIVTDIPAELVGVQKLILHREKEVTEHHSEGTPEPVAITTRYEYTAVVDGYNTPLELLAVNDGLTPEEYKAWFAPVFDREKADTLEFAIIHFTKERY